MPFLSPFWTEVWFGLHEPGWRNFFDTAARRFAVFWPMVLCFSTTGSAFLALCILGCWLLSGHWLEKWRQIRSNPVSLTSLGLWILSLVGCLYSSADRADLIRAMENGSNFFVIVVLVTIFNKPCYRNAAVTFFHLGMLALLITKIGMMLFYGPDSETALMKLLDYVTLGIMLVTWMLLILYRPFSWKTPWCLERGFVAPESLVPVSVTKPTNDSSLLSNLISKGNSWLVPRYLIAFGLAIFLLAANRGRTVHICLAAVLAVMLIWNFRGVVLLRLAAVFIGVLLLAITCIPMVRERCLLAYHEFVAFQADNSAVFKGEESSVGRRLFMYKYGLHIATHAPVFGTGSGGIGAEFDKELAPFRKNSNVTWQGRIDDPHCEYLAMLIQYGVVGLIGYLVWLGVQWQYAVKLSWPWSLLGRCLGVMIALSTLFSSYVSNPRIGCYFAVMLALFFSAEKAVSEIPTKRP